MRIDDAGGTWSASASAALVAPSATEPMPDIAQEILGWQDRVSLAYGINWAIEQVCGVNCFEYMASAFTGSWEDFSKAGDALGNLSDWTRHQRIQLEGTITSMSFAWKGEAAAAAQGYFANLDTALGTIETALQGLAKDYQSTATGVFLAGQAAVSAIQELCDWLIALAIELVAAASTSWTGIGAVIGGAAAAYTAWEARQVWLEALTWHGRAVAIAQAFSGLAAGNLALLHGLEGVSLPGGTYDSPRT